ncbi:MAG: cytochrome c maturation protein CcmE [Candidatus Hodarchaeota archaeon]
MVNAKNTIIASFIIIICSGGFLLLLANSSVPMFTVKELMDNPRPESLINKKIQIIGVVKTFNSTSFYIYDPEDVSNESLLIYVNSTNVERPTGFEIGRTVLIEGKLLTISNIWKFRASSISTKCPSKYQ